MVGAASKQPKQRDEHIHLLKQVGQACFQLFDPELLLDRVALLLCDVLGIPQVTIGLVRGSSLHIVASGLGWIEDLAPIMPLVIPLSQHHGYGLVQAEQRSVYIADIQHQPFVNVGVLPKTINQLIVPLVNETTLVGLIDIQTTTDDVDLLAIQPIMDIVAQQLALALAHIHAHQLATQRARYNELIEVIRRRSNLQLNTQSVYQTIVEMTCNMLAVRAAGLYLPEGSIMQLVAECGSSKFLSPMSVPFIPQAIAQYHIDDPNDAPIVHTTDLAKNIALTASNSTLAVLQVVPFLPFSEIDHNLLIEIGQRLGNVIDRHRLFRSMFNANERSSLFARIVNLIRQTLNIRDVIHEVTISLSTWLHCDFCTVAIQEQNELRFYGTYRTYITADHQNTIDQILHHELQQAIQLQRRPEPEQQFSPEFAATLQTLNIRALTWVPLQVEGKWLGVICVYNLHRPHLWSLDEQRLLSDIADQLALVFRQMYVYEAEQQRRRELEALQDIIHAISGQLDLRTLCQNVVLRVVDVFHVPAAAVLMWSADKQTMNVVAHHGFSSDYLQHLDMSHEQVEYWLKRYPLPQPLYIPDLRRVSLLGGTAAVAADITSLFAQPLIVNGEFSGWLQMYCQTKVRQWSEEESQLLAAIAQQISQAIYTAHRYTEEHLLRTDAEQSYNDLRRVLTELEQAREHMINSEKLRALGQLSSGVAHDFNNLLASILGNTQLLLFDEPSTERRETLQLIERAAKDGAVTVRRIQEYARSAETVYDDVVDLADVARGAIDFTRPWWRDKANQRGINIEIRTHLLESYVRGSAAELREVCVNLIANAVDALPRGGIITVSSGIVSRWAYVSIADNGRGVSAENRSRIFDPFFTTKSIGEGTGMGLSVALSIAQRHGGQLNLDDVKPHGARFTVLLPHYHAPPPPSRPAAAVPQPEVQRILIVDDDISVRSVMARVLAHDKHIITTAASGEEALRWLDERTFDILLSDLGMPGMNGWELIAQARRRRPSLITVLITGWGYHPDIDHAAARGVDIVLTKPFDMQTLRNTIGDAARKRAKSGDRRA